jgi:acetamidase/formamidase
MNDTSVSTVIRQHIPIGHLKYTLSQFHEPVARVQPGELFEVDTELNIGGHNVRSLDDHIRADSFVIPFVNPATGPIYVEGAQPGQVLKVRIHQVELVGYGYTALWPGVGIFADWVRQEEFGVQSHIVRVEGGVVHWSDDIKIPAAPMVGVIGTAPWVESVSTIDNGPHGGNMDVQEVTAGNVVMLPVWHEGALLHMGDVHAVQGDAECNGIGAIEIRGRVTLSIDLAPKPSAMTWPRIETPEHICTVACARPLDDALRLAFQEMVRWLEQDYGFRKEEAYMLLGSVAEARCTQMVNPKFTYICKVRKSLLRHRR